MATTTNLAPLAMVDLKTQYHRLRTEIDQAVLATLESTQFIGGPNVQAFREELERYLGVAHVIRGEASISASVMAGPSGLLHERL